MDKWEAPCIDGQVHKFGRGNERGSWVCVKCDVRPPAEIERQLTEHVDKGVGQC